MFPKNTWFVAITPDDIACQPLGCMIYDEHIVFYRGAEGKVVALEYFCLHRGAPR